MMRIWSRAPERAPRRACRRWCAGGKPEGAHKYLKTLKPGPALSQDDINRLYSYAAFAYLIDTQDETALTLAEETVQRDGAAQSQSRWTAGLASYRMSQFERAATHFEALSQSGGTAARTYSGAAFWAARSWMRAGKPDRVVPLYERAASEPGTFYGLLASRMLGRDMGTEFAEPKSRRRTRSRN